MLLKKKGEIIIPTILSNEQLKVTPIYNENISNLNGLEAILPKLTNVIFK